MTSLPQVSQSSSEKPWRSWWVFYKDPTEPQGSPWHTYGSISGPYTADEAIAATAGRRFDQPFWAFALDKGDHGSYYDLHHPAGVEPHPAVAGRRIGPSGYVSETLLHSRETESEGA